jgi:hypothetical protein
MDKSLLKIDGVIWNPVGSTFEPLCPKHHLRFKIQDWNSNFLSCAECNASYHLPRSYFDELIYVKNKLDSKVFKKLKILNLDDEAVPLAEMKLKSEDEKYFVTGLLTESKVGLRLIIYAGEKGKQEKTQIFVEPDIKRLAFDQKDLHPSEVFLKVEGIFADNTKASIENSTMKKSD